MVEVTDPKTIASLMKEWEFTERVIEEAHLNNWHVAHFRPARTEQGWRTAVSADGAGFPDLVLVKAGHPVLFVELKKGTAKPSPAQQVWLGLLAQCPGIDTYLWRTTDDFQGIIDILQEEAIKCLGPSMNTNS